MNRKLHQRLKIQGTFQRITWRRSVYKSPCPMSYGKQSTNFGWKIFMISQWEASIAVTWQAVNQSEARVGNKHYVTIRYYQGGAGYDQWESIFNPLLSQRLTGLICIVTIYYLLTSYRVTWLLGSNDNNLSVGMIFEHPLNTSYGSDSHSMISLPRELSYAMELVDERRRL